MYFYMHVWANRTNPMYHRRKENGKNQHGEFSWKNPNDEEGTFHKSEISMSTFLESENVEKLIY